MIIQLIMLGFVFQNDVIDEKEEKMNSEEVARIHKEKIRGECSQYP